jgi:nucleoside-diphosphate-sugar epimerase
MLIPQLVRKVEQGDAILLDGDDGLSISPVAIADVVSTIERCLDGRVPGTFNVAGPEVLSLRQVGHAIGEVIGKSPAFSQRLGAAGTLAGETGALRRALGWAPDTTFTEGLRQWLSGGLSAR